MPDKLISSKQVCEMLEITPNNLRQITWRGKKLKWVEKKGKEVFYSLSEVKHYGIMRDRRIARSKLLGEAGK